MEQTVLPLEAWARAVAVPVVAPSSVRSASNTAMTVFVSNPAPTTRRAGLQHPCRDPREGGDDGETGKQR